MDSEKTGNKLGISKAFILAGGRGERLGELGKDKPKVMMNVQGKPLLEWNIELCKKYGITQIVLGVGYLHEQIESYFGNGKKFRVQISYSVEKEFLGTAGAFKLAEPFFESEKKFVMMNGDEVKDVLFEKLNQVFESEQAWAADALVPTPDVSKSGSVKLDGHFITDFLEKNPKAQNEKGLVNAGAYILSEKIFGLILPCQKVSIERDIFPRLARDGHMVGVSCLGQWFQTDTLEKLQKAENQWKTRFNKKETHLNLF
ncbi:MAG: nucleotidyltransferase family protein [Candidatus Micrarchaeota archaeon]